MTKEQAPRAQVILAHFAEQAGWCERLGSPFTAELIGQFAEDFRRGGPVARLVSDWAGNPRADALALRLCAALHGAVLSGRAPELAAVYPRADHTPRAAEVWPLVHTFLTKEEDWVRAYLTSAPQTNETARSIALLPGFLKLAAQSDLPMSLLELGASAGLNQNWDAFGYKTGSWSRAGASDVVISTDWHGKPPAHLDAEVKIARRAGCDLQPLDIHTPDDALRLRSYIWPDQIERLARFDGAVKLARAKGTRIDTADALDWLKAQLGSCADGELTVIYHSVFLQYPPPATIAAIKEVIQSAGDNASTSAPLAWLCCEPQALFGAAANSARMITRLQTWPAGATEILGMTDGHITRFKAL